MSELFDKGLKVRKEVLGEDYVNKSIAGADEFIPDDGRVVDRVLLGRVVDQAGSGPPHPQHRQSGDARGAELASRTEAARQGGAENGPTKDEIKEILLQVAVYCGIPSGIDAFRNAREAFNEVDAK